jgi:Flp pilus assembly protein CpaB
MQPDLYPGIAITAEDLHAVELAPRYLPEGSFLRAEHLFGWIPHERILARKTIRADRLADFESGRGLSAVIPRGMRAMSINIDHGPAPAGLLNPGSYIDVITHIYRDGQAITETPHEGISSRAMSTASPKEPAPSRPLAISYMLAG